MKSQTVIFVVDKQLDISSHLIALNSYKRNTTNGFPQNKDFYLEKLSAITSQEKIMVKK
ncbi:MAG: hypothetical protein NT098_00680 [Candidatus Parcubacteria bacterium]|nr:hypothetical protein [Candidatus Parcubacteria bacterium]